MNAEQIQKMSFYAMFHYLWQRLAAKRRFQIMVYAVLMLVSALSEIFVIGLLMPFLLILTSPEQILSRSEGKFLVEYLDVSSADILALLTSIFIGSICVSGAIRLFSLWVKDRLAQAIGSDISCEVFRRTLYQPYTVHITRNSSEAISSVLTKSKFVVTQGIIPCLTILSGAQLVVLIFLALVVIDAFIAIMLFVGLGGIYLAIIHLTKRRLALFGERVNSGHVKMLKMLQEGFMGIREIILEDMQESCFLKYSHAEKVMRHSLARISFIGQAPRYLIETFGLMFIALLAFVMTQKQGKADVVPILGAFALGGQRLLQSIQQVYSAWATMKGGQASLRDTLLMLEQPLPDYLGNHTQHLLPFDREIVLKQVSFRYADNMPWVLDGINLILPKGGCTGFIGETGSGKSTLADIIMGLLPATKGQLVVDGAAINMENSRAWQKHIAHVPQAFFIQDVSVAENIAFAVPVEEIDFDRVHRVAEMAHIAGTIESWPRQYETVLGERGIRISGGQGQRIAIARALYRESNVFVLDEATSALDNETEHIVMNFLKNLSNDITTIIIAHRLTTLKSCDQVVVLKNGCIERVGSYADIVIPMLKTGKNAN